MNKILCAALAASAVFGAATASQAEEARMRVRMGDINLATQTGAQTALARIRYSAASFCEAEGGRQPLERAVVVDRCVAEMTRKGVERLNAPLVTALLNGAAPAKPATQVALAD